MIVAAVDDLPDDLPAETLDQAEAFLLREARHDAKALRILGRRLLEVVDPEAADARRPDASKQKSQRRALRRR